MYPQELKETITKVFALQKTLFPSCLSEFIGSNVFSRTFLLLLKEFLGLSVPFKTSSNKNKSGSSSKKNNFFLVISK